MLQICSQINKIVYLCLQIYMCLYRKMFTYNSLIDTHEHILFTYDICTQLVIYTQTHCLLVVLEFLDFT